MTDTNGDRYVWDVNLRQWVPVTGALSPAELANEMQPVLSSRYVLLDPSAGAQDLTPLIADLQTAGLSNLGASVASLAGYGLADAADISTVIAAAVADDRRHLIVPYAAAAWPALTTITLEDVWLDFEPGARISFNHADNGLELTNCRLSNASFTSTYTGPNSIADATAAAYGFPAREVLLNDGNLIDGSYYHENAATGIHITGAYNTINCSPKFDHIRHQQGWAAAIHLDGAACHDNVCTGYVTITDADRGIECEAGAQRCDFLAGGRMTDVYPAGYTGSGSAASYAAYTFILDAHAHTGEGGPKNISYHGTWTLENCGGGITFVRSTGTNDSDLARDCYVEHVRMVGRGIGVGGYEAIALQGYGHRVGRVTFAEGAGITGTFNVRLYAQSSGVTIGDLVTEDAASAAALTVSGSPAIGSAVRADFVSTVGDDPALMAQIISGGSVTNPSANAAILVRCRANRTLRPNRLRWIAGTQSGNYDIGIYDANGTLLWAKGSTAAPVSGTIDETFTAVGPIRAGDEFYVAFATDNTTQTYRGITLATGTMCADTKGRFAAITFGTSFPLPSTLSISGGSAVLRIPAISVHEA